MALGDAVFVCVHFLIECSVSFSSPFIWFLRVECKCRSVKKKPAEALALYAVLTVKPKAGRYRKFYYFNQLSSSIIFSIKRETSTVNEFGRSSMVDHACRFIITTYLRTGEQWRILATRWLNWQWEAGSETTPVSYCPKNTFLRRSVRNWMTCEPWEYPWVTVMRSGVRKLDWTELNNSVWLSYTEPLMN